MPTQLRFRLLLSALLTVALIGALVGLVIVERSELIAGEQGIVELKDAMRQARELSLYVQYNAHDTNAYTLGHLEHREEFVEHAAAFQTIAESLRVRFAENGDAEDNALIEEAISLRVAYDAAALVLFDAADANRTNSTPANQADEDAAWEWSDKLGDELDDVSSRLATHLAEEISAEQTALEARNTRMLALVIVLGLVIAGLTLFIQRSFASALGRPLDQLLATVERFSAGDLDARTGLQRQDEVGILAAAFDTMAAQLSRQTADLQIENNASRAAQERAEAAQRELAEQLATVELQQQVIREMSVPILPLSDRSLVLPLVGALDSARLSLIQDQALAAIEERNARHLVLDVTGVPVIDSHVAQGILRLVDAARLLGTRVMLVGIRPEVAQSIVGLGLQLDNIVTRSTLQSGLASVLGQEQARSK